MLFLANKMDLPTALAPVELAQVRQCSQLAWVHVQQVPQRIAVNSMKGHWGPNIDVEISQRNVTALKSFSWAYL